MSALIAPANALSRLERPRTPPAYGTLLAITCTLLLLLPFVTTFDDFLTAAAIRLGLDGALQGLVPAEARMVVAMLSFAGVHASTYGSKIILQNGGYSQTLFISWNCIGWQSLLLVGISLLSGLRGNHPIGARIQVVLIALLGTFLVNLLRICGVVLLAATAGYVPAVLFHDYGGVLMTVAWLFAFWALAYRLILPEPEMSPA